MQQAIWWGEARQETGECKGWEIGPLAFYLSRNLYDWRLHHLRIRDPESDRFVVAQSTDSIPEGAEQLRFQFKESPESLSLVPVLADRPAVVRTDAPLRLPAGQKIVFYMTTIVRLAFRHGAHELLEIPVFELQDTWFGTNIRGELCYASTTLARTDFDQVPVRPYRPVTPVTLINRSNKTLSLEKFKLPLPYLRLHVTAEGRLFTDGIDLIYDRGDEQIEVRTNRGVDPKLKAAALVSPARKKLDIRERLSLEGFLQR